MAGKIKNKILADQQGVVLVMSLMILLVMMISVISLAQVIFGEIKMTRNADNSIVAFYAAESGIERGLFLLKFSKKQGDLSYFDRLADADPEYNNYSLDLERSVSFVEATTTVEYYETYYISTTTPARVDIVRPEGDIPSAAAGLPESFKLEWNIDSCYEDGHASDKMEIVYTSLYKLGGVLKSETKQILAVCGCSVGNAKCDDVESNVLDDNKFYYFIFRPLDSEVSYIKFTPYTENNQGGDAYLPSEVLIQANGYYRQSMHSMSARVSAYTPLSNIFTYVIFSEEDLEKGF
ncbi:hypothetical protein HOD19_00290 [bacterium]|jgi:hypothetical protein|nr:hypothetical protein [bacterium]MBT4649325.1 hypothetical protein [bacterium]